MLYSSIFAMEKMPWQFFSLTDFPRDGVLFISVTLISGVTKSAGNFIFDEIIRLYVYLFQTD